MLEELKVESWPNANWSHGYVLPDEHIVVDVLGHEADMRGTLFVTIRGKHKAIRV